MNMNRFRSNSSSPARCPECTSESLFDGFFDEDGYGFPVNIDTPKEQIPAGVEWRTSCNDCGWLGHLRQPRSAA